MVDVGCKVTLAFEAFNTQRSSCQSFIPQLSLGNLKHCVKEDSLCELHIECQWLTKQSWSKRIHAEVEESSSHKDNLS